MVTGNAEMVGLGNRYRHQPLIRDRRFGGGEAGVNRRKSEPGTRVDMDYARGRVTDHRPRKTIDFAAHRLVGIGRDTRQTMGGNPICLSPQQGGGDIGDFRVDLMAGKNAHNQIL